MQRKSYEQGRKDGGPEALAVCQCRSTSQHLRWLIEQHLQKRYPDKG